MAGSGKSAVLQALIGNGILTVIKFVAFVMSGSGAMMSEAVHSFADTANQALLFIGVKRSMRPADETFAYGYGADRFVFALMSAMGIFILGCGVTIYHGVHSLLHPPELNVSWITFVVLGISLLVDGYVLAAAVKEVLRTKGDKSFVKFVKESTDPTLIAVLFEDSVASLGVIIAAIGIAISQLTGNPMFDAISSILIGIMLGVLAVWLGLRNRALILGPSLPDDKREAIFSMLIEQESVLKVREFRTRIMGAGRFRIAAEVDYDGPFFGKKHAEWLKSAVQDSKSGEVDWESVAGEMGEKVVQSLADEVDRIEAEMVKKFPKLRNIDLEAD